jgi:uncharacterized protein (DUF4415 family)
VSLFARKRDRDPHYFGAQGNAEGTARIRAEGQAMRKEYDFAKMKGRRNPYARELKKQITIRVGVDILEYFKDLAEETGIPYQNLINLYLRDCVVSKKRPSLSWAS